MAWVFFVLGGAVVLAIAFVALGRTVGRLERQRPPAIFEVVAAVRWIASRLPDEVTARVSYDDVETVVGWHLDWFTEVGVSSEHGEELAGEGVVHEGAVAIEEAAIDAVVARAIAETAAGGPDIDPVDVVCVLDLQMRYLQEIGAVSAAVDGEITPQE
jgi:hypothetical protein